MEDHATNHALTEVALALAMAFFSIMVLAMVSMSIPRNTTSASVVKSSPTPMPKDSLQLSATTNEANKSETQSVSGENKDKVFVFYFNHKFYDQQLKPLNLRAMAKAKTLVLALPPQLTVGQAMAVQQQINRPDVVITQFNQQWQQRLEKMK